MEDEVLVDAAARLQSGGIDVGPDWGQVTGARRRSSTDGDVVATTVAESTRRQRRLRGVRDEAGKGCRMSLFHSVGLAHPPFPSQD